MGKRTYESDIAAMALLYRKKYAYTDMLSYDKILSFDKVINNNLDDMESTCGISIRSESDSKLYYILSGENRESYAVINPNADLKAAWEYHIGCLPIDILIASEMDNALKEIGLIIVNDKTGAKRVYLITIYKPVRTIEFYNNNYFSSKILYILIFINIRR